MPRIDNLLMYFPPARITLRLAEHVDFVVCLGGDGVILHANYLFQSNIPPVSEEVGRGGSREGRVRRGSASVVRTSKSGE